MISKKEFAYKLEWEGWDYILQEINPEEIADAALAEALQDAQEAFQVLLKVAPTVDDFMEDDDLDYTEEDFDQEITTVEELDFEVD